MPETLGTDAPKEPNTTAVKLVRWQILHASFVPLLTSVQLTGEIQAIYLLL